MKYIFGGLIVLLLFVSLPARVHIPLTEDNHGWIEYDLMMMNRGKKIDIKSIETIETIYFPRGQQTFMVEFTINDGDIQTKHFSYRNTSWKQALLDLL